MARKEDFVLEEEQPKRIQRLKRKIRQLRVSGDYSDLFGDPVPEGLQGEYPTDDVDGGLSRKLQGKYRKRPNNIGRCWNRVQLYLPELMHHDGPKKKILEMSTAHGGMLEVLRHFGHEVVGNDFVNFVAGAKQEERAYFRDLNATDFGRTHDDYGIEAPKEGEDLVEWPYRKIIESIEIPMRLFDGGKVPYPIDDKEFDVVLCMQAIEHYCHPKDWMDILDEFCRISTSTIVLLLNPLMDGRAGEPGDYRDEYRKAKLALRQYRKNGFICTGCYMMWGEPAGFKLTAM